MRHFPVILRGLLATLILLQTPAFGLDRLIEILEVGVTDSSDVVVAAGTVTFYDAGTSNLRTVYQDFALATPHANPATLDAAGRLVAYSDKRIKVLIKNSAGSTVRTVDNVGTSDADIAASAIAGGIATIVPIGLISPYGGATAPSGWLLCDGSEYSQADYAALFAIVSTTFNTGGETAGYFRVPAQARKTLVGAGGTGTAILANTRGSSGGTETHTVLAANLPVHGHGVTALTVGNESAHTHGAGSYSGSGATADFNATVTTVGHGHSVWVEAGAAGVDPESIETSGRFGAYSSVGSGSNYIQSSTDTITAAELDARQTNHTHTVTGTSGAGSTHTHTITGTTDTVGSGTAMNIMQPSLVVNYIIKY